jgi:transcriptional regulator of arginine metabolism
MALRQILAQQPLSRQEDVVEALAGAGFRASQATVSRDLAEIGAVKVVDEDGGERYRLSSSMDVGGEGFGELRRALEAFMLDMAASANLLVLKTLPAGAGPVAAAVDRVGLEGVAGTVAGDDTVLVVAEETSSARTVEDRLRRILED